MVGSLNLNKQILESAIVWIHYYHIFVYRRHRYIEFIRKPLPGTYETLKTHRWEGRLLRSCGPCIPPFASRLLVGSSSRNLCSVFRGGTTSVRGNSTRQHVRNPELRKFSTWDRSSKSNSWSRYFRVDVSRICVRSNNSSCCQAGPEYSAWSIRFAFLDWICTAHIMHSTS